MDTFDISQPKTYLKAIIGFLVPLCALLATQSEDGLTLAEVFMSIGGALVTSGGVFYAPNKKATPTPNDGLTDGTE